jgi:hypothetical protein
MLMFLKNTVPEVLKSSGINPAQVIGIATDFTACTVLPVKTDGIPLSELPEFSKTHMPSLSYGSTMRRNPTQIALQTLLIHGKSHG